MPAYRARQIFQWVYRNHVADPLAMANIPKKDRGLLAERLRFSAGRVLEHQIASDGTQKLLMQWPPRGLPEPSPGNPYATKNDNHLSLPLVDDANRQTECVMIPSITLPGVEGPSPSRPRKTACISSQVGCPVGCRFCASGLGGLEDNLTRGQIVEQVWRLAGVADDVQSGACRNSQQTRIPRGKTSGGVSHVVFMGMGEPLANLEQVIAALRTLTSDWGMGISARRITISTVGLPAQIRRLAEMKLPVTLALSLHAPNDELRRRLIPWAHT